MFGGRAGGQKGGDMEHVTVDRTSTQTSADLPASHRQAIRLRGVCKQFEGKRNVTALDGINLDIAHGEMVAIVGPSGSGKSTLLNLIGTLDRPSSGSILIDGQAIDSLGDVALT